MRLVFLALFYLEGLVAGETVVLGLLVFPPYMLFDVLDAPEREPEAVGMADPVVFVKDTCQGLLMAGAETRDGLVSLS